MSSTLSSNQASALPVPAQLSASTPAGNMSPPSGIHLRRPSRLRISVLREIPEDPDLRRQWNALVCEVHRPQVFYTYEWARAVQLALGDTLHPLLVLAYDDAQKLAGVVALATTIGNRVSFLCATTGDYCDFLARPHDAAFFVDEVFQTLRQLGFRDFTLTNFPEDSPAFAAVLRAAGNSGFHSYARTAYLCAQVRLSTLETNTAGKVHLPRQKMVRRFLKAMADDGPVSIVHEGAWRLVDDQLPFFFRTHVARFLYTGRISNLVRPERRKFLCDLAQLLSETGWLCLSQVRSGARTISWNYGFRFQRNWFWYQPTFDSALEHYSPGFVLLSKLIEEAAGDPAIDAVDMGLGAEGYKDRFSNATRRTMYVTVHRSLFAHWKEIARFRTATFISGLPPLEKFVRALIASGRAVQVRARTTGIWSTCSWGLRRALRLLFWQEEVFFFEASAPAGESPDKQQLVPISLDLLADVAMQCFDDDQTLAYLVRAAARLNAGTAQGFTLLDGHGRIVHLAWVTSFAGFFLDELQHTLDCPDPDRVMLFDCWTPVSSRGKGYYAETIRRVAQLKLVEGKRPWIFSAASNSSSLSGIAKSGFQFRHSLVTRTLLGLHTVTPGSSTPGGETPPPVPDQA